MRVLVVTNKVFTRRSGGGIVSSGTLGYSFWRRYLDVFSGVRVLARVKTEDGGQGEPVEGDGVEVVPLPAFQGPAGYLSRALAVRRRLRRLALESDAVILRGCGPIHGALLRKIERAGRPYGMEVIADPATILARGGARVAARPFFRCLLARQLRAACLGASACAYVTAGHLQRLYPPAPEAFVTNYSSVILGPDCFREPRRSPPSEIGTILSIGSMDYDYKGFDTLIEAVARRVAAGDDLSLVILGDGARRAGLERRAHRLGVAGRVRFPGHVEAGEVRRRMDQVDLFVLASRSEGLPRAMIECMARGTPCIGSQVGGIPELLALLDLFPPDDPAALASLIQTLSPERQKEMAQRQYRVAQRYSEEELGTRRRAFCYHLASATREARASTTPHADPSRFPTSLP